MERNQERVVVVVVVQGGTICHRWLVRTMVFSNPHQRIPRHANEPTRNAMGLMTLLLYYCCSEIVSDAGLRHHTLPSCLPSHPTWSAPHHTNTCAVPGLALFRALRLALPRIDFIIYRRESRILHSYTPTSALAWC